MILTVDMNLMITVTKASSVTIKVSLFLILFYTGYPYQLATLFSLEVP